jgi:hypothetical protein
VKATVTRVSCGPTPFSPMGRNASSWRSIGRKAACRRPSGSVRGMAATNSPCPRTSPRSAQQLVRVSHRYILRCQSGQGRAEEFHWRQSQRARPGGGCSGLLGQEHIPCDVRLPAWTPIHTKFSPLKAAWLQNRLAFDIPRRGRYRCIPIVPGDENAKLFLKG